MREKTTRTERGSKGAVVPHMVPATLISIHAFRIKILCLMLAFNIIYC